MVQSETGRIFAKWLPGYDISAQFTGVYLLKFLTIFPTYTRHEDFYLLNRKTSSSINDQDQVHCRPKMNEKTMNERREGKYKYVEKWEKIKEQKDKKIG